MLKYVGSDTFDCNGDAIAEIIAIEVRYDTYALLFLDQLV